MRLCTTGSGLSRAERELGAIAASIVNRCVYCAAVHTVRHAQLTKSEETVDAILAAGETASLSPRDQAIYEFSSQLSQTPSAATAEHISALQAQGLNELEILDLVLSTSLFGWANRLMHVLGDPVTPDHDS